MRILCVGHSVANPRQRQMWKYIAEQGHEVLLVSMLGIDGGAYDQGESVGNFKLIMLPALNSRYPSMWTLNGIQDIIFAFNPDIIFAMQEPWEYLTFQLSNVARVIKKPFGFFTWENLHKILPVPLAPFCNDVINNSHFAVCGNIESAKIIAERGCINVNVLLQTGLDENTFFPEPTIDIRNEDEPIKLLYIGRLVKEKGIETILKAMEQLDPEKYILRIVGGRGQPEIVEQIKQYQQSHKNITLEEWVPYNKVPEVLNWADLLLMPSIDSPEWKEQCGYIIGEALLCGVPVITSTSSSIMEIWGKCPDVQFINQGDVGMLVDTIKEFKPYLATKGRDWVTKNLSYKVVGDKYIEIFKEVTHLD